MDKDEYLCLEDEFIVLAIPSTTVEVEITAKIWNNGEVMTVKRTMPFQEVRAAFDEAREGYIPYDSVYILNEDYDKSKLERLLKKYCGEEEDGED